MLAFFVGTWSAGSILSAPFNQSIGNLPSDVTGRNVEFESASGATIRGWLIPGEKGAGAVVLMHGVRASRLSMLKRARFLFRAGYTVLLFDFQGHGESTGERITFGYLESKDAQAAISFLRSKAPDEKIGVIGVSMGGAAVLLSSPPLDVDAAALEMVYPTIEQAISNRLAQRLGKWSSVFTPLLSWQFRPRLGVGVEALSPKNRVGKVTAPKLFIVGEEDRRTTIEESLQMYTAASEPKELWVVEGVGHVDSYRALSEEYEQRMLAFFEKHLRQ